MQRRFSGSARLLFILVLLVTFGTAGSAVRPQATAGQGDFARTAAAAIAHGKRADAERPGGAAGGAWRPQATAGRGDSARRGAAAIAHGRRADAERLATARGASDPAAAVV